MSDAPGPLEVANQGKPRSRRRMIIEIAVSLAVVVLVFVFVLPRIADYGEAWTAIKSMTLGAIGLLLVVAAWNIASYWPLLMASQPGLRLGECAVSNLTATAASNSFPAGAAVGLGTTLAMQHSWGIRRQDLTVALIVSGVWNQFTKLGAPIIALAILAVTGRANAALTTAAFVGVAVLIAAIVLFVLIFRSQKLAGRIGDAFGRLVSWGLKVIKRPPLTGVGERFMSFRAQTIGLISRRWFWMTIFAIVSHLSLFLVLLVSLRAVGVRDSEVGWPVIFAAFCFVRLVSAIPITPGGLGVVELGLTAALAAGQPEAVDSRIAAGVLVYRALTWLLPIPLGVGAYFFWRANRSWRRTTAERDREFGRVEVAGSTAGGASA